MYAKFDRDLYASFLLMALQASLLTRLFHYVSNLAILRNKDNLLTLARIVLLLRILLPFSK